MPSRVRETVTGAFDVENVRKIGQTRSSCAGAWSSGTASTSYSGSVHTKRIEDHTTPGFFSKLAKGECLPNNGCRIDDITETRTASHGLHQLNFVGGCYRQQTIGPHWSLRTPLVVLPPHDNDIVNVVSQQARGKCLASIFDALTTLAELKQTSRLIVNAWGRVEDFASRAAKFARRSRSLKGAAVAFGEKWLEYRYGWLPAIYSAEDAMKAFNAMQNGRKLISEKSTVSVPFSLSDTKHTTSPTGSGGMGTVNQTDSINGTRRYTGAAWGWADSTQRKYFGFDPLLTTWELVPYSFVVDWFLGVGTFIKSVSPFGGVAIAGGSCSITDDYTFEQTWDYSYSAGEVGSGGPISTVKHVRSYLRFGNTPGAVPVWNPNLTPERVIDAFALILAGDRRVRSLIRK